MKSLYTFLFISSLLLMSFNTVGQNAEKTLVKGFNLAGNSVVMIDADEHSSIELNNWNQDQMRVIMTVSLGNGSDMMLKSLVKVGRYNLDSSSEPDHLRIFLPGLERKVKLRNGGTLIENIKFEVFKPSHVKVKSTMDDVVAEILDSKI